MTIYILFYKGIHGDREIVWEIFKSLGDAQKYLVDRGKVDNPDYKVKQFDVWENDRG